ncbi:MAG TPA: transcriptional repressor [Bryobacteraceae bacterium]|nr:transcriptional repressor [Bryobacteraceae bacterium]
MEEVCRRNGLPLTIQRRLTLEALARRRDHPTADQVLEDVRKQMPEISRPTVYRVLEALVRIGVARKVCHPGAAARYETETRRHHHLVCLDCEEMVDVDAPYLDHLRLPDVRSRFHIEDYSIQFRGLCSRCARKSSSRRARNL